MKCWEYVRIYSEALTTSTATSPVSGRPGGKPWASRSAKESTGCSSARCQTLRRTQTEARP